MGDKYQVCAWIVTLSVFNFSSVTWQTPDVLNDLSVLHDQADDREGAIIATKYY